MYKGQESFPPYLISYFKKKINLAEFLETEIGCTLNWYEPDIAAGTICPMPHHSEKKGSFRIKYVEEDGLWIYHCLGCEASGTIIDFCMDYYNLSGLAKTISFMCEKFNVKDSPELAAEGFQETGKKINIQKKMDYANIVTSNQCRVLLRKDYNRYNKWVGNAYRRLNEALDKGDIETVESIGFEVSNKMGEK